MKKTIVLTLPMIIFSLGISSCKKEPDLSFKYEEYQKEVINDKYRTMYQIFPASFADGNGDGMGDLQGIIDKLDYIESLNYTGIWLNPIHSSHTTHHYDVENYYDVASVFGGMEKLDELVSKCHERNMTIILDLVLNHSSDQNEWFTNSYIAAKAGKTTKPEYARYNWIECTGNAPTGYSKVNSTDKIAYEAEFDKSMPDFNLQQILDDGDGDLGTEFKNIFKFWLEDHNVDGFRLDAVSKYFTGDQARNKAMMTWINTECKKIKPDCYLVGEGSWGSNSQENQDYQESGMDSLFQFANSAKNAGYVSSAVVQQDSKTIYTALKRNRENANGGIEAPFLSNHDVPRYLGSVSGRKNIANAKYAMGLFATLGGCTFTYYGDEMGMASQSTIADGWYRLPVRWGENDTHNVKVSKLSLYGVQESKIDDEMSYPHGTVEAQLANEDSLINFVKKANLIRLQFPELARGDAELVYNPSSPFAIIKRTYNGSSIYMALNSSITYPMEFDYSLYGEKVVGELCANGKVVRKSEGSTTIVVPTQGIAIIK